MKFVNTPIYKFLCEFCWLWNKLAQLLEDQEDIIAALKAELALAKGEDQATEITDIDAFRAEMMGQDRRVPA